MISRTLLQLWFVIKLSSATKPFIFASPSAILSLTELSSEKNKHGVWRRVNPLHRERTQAYITPSVSITKETKWKLLNTRSSDVYEEIRYLCTYNLTTMALICLMIFVRDWPLHCTKMMLNIIRFKIEYLYSYFFHLVEYFRLTSVTYVAIYVKLRY